MFVRAKHLTKQAGPAPAAGQPNAKASAGGKSLETPPADGPAVAGRRSPLGSGGLGMRSYVCAQ
eukprot:4793361-Alexandrium_andersonii.AAC.1